MAILHFFQSGEPVMLFVDNLTATWPHFVLVLHKTREFGESLAARFSKCYARYADFESIKPTCTMSFYNILIS